MARRKGVRVKVRAMADIAGLVCCTEERKRRVVRGVDDDLSGNPKLHVRTGWTDGVCVKGGEQRERAGRSEGGLVEGNVSSIKEGSR